MKTIVLLEHQKPYIMMALPAGGWLINISHGKDSRVLYCPMIVFPDKESVVMSRKGYFCACHTNRDHEKFIYFVRNSNNGHELERRLLGKDGSFVSSIGEGIQYYINPDFHGIGFNGWHVDNERLDNRILKAAAGVLKGGVILWRQDNDQTITFDFPCDTGQITVSADGLTVIIGHKNTLTIIDNPLI